MIKKDSLAKLLKAVKLPDDVIAKALSDEEVDVELPADLNVLTKTELDSRDRNTYDRAKKAGEEMLVKAMKQKHGIDVPGEDADKFVEAVIAKAVKDANIAPDEKIKEAEKKVEQWRKKAGEAETLAGQLRTEKEQLQSDTEILSMLPNNRLSSMSNEEHLLLTKSNIKIEVKDGKKVAVRNGEVVVDSKTLEPVAVKDVITNLYAEKKWIEQPADPAKPAGPGGKNSTMGGIKQFSKMSEAVKHIEEQGLNIQGEKGAAALQAIIKENKGIDMSS